MHKLDEVLAHSHQLQGRLKERVGQTWEQWRHSSEVNQLLHHYTERLKHVIVKLIQVVNERILIHPYVDKCKDLARHSILSLYKRCLPVLAHLSENSLLSAGLGFGLGVCLTYWTLSHYYQSYYGSIVKPRTMSAVTFDPNQCNGLDSIGLRSDVLVPKITNAYEVLVRVHAASVDSADIAILSGYGRNERNMYRRQSDILGRDFSGVVLDVGRNVKNVKVGDAVWAALPIAMNGALREFIVIQSHLLSLRPKNLSHDGAATLPYSCLKVWDALVWQGGIKPLNGLRDKNVLIVDGGSPTGCIALQVAKAWQAAHITTCVHHRVSPLAKHLGADRVISLPHHPEDAEIRCRDLFESEDSFFDVCIITSEDSSLSEEFCSEFTQVLVKSSCERRLSSDTYGFMRRFLLHKWRKVYLSSHHKFDSKILDHFKQMVDNGKLQPVLDSAYAYEQAEEAFQCTATTPNVGKTIVTFGLRGQQQQRELAQK